MRGLEVRSCIVTKPLLPFDTKVHSMRTMPEDSKTESCQVAALQEGALH